MTDSRLDSLNEWLTIFFGDQNFFINSANDDASFRRYFRVKHNHNVFIAMDSPPEKENNDNFIKIAALLKKNHLYTPKIIKSDLKQGFLLIQDLGSLTFLQAFKQNNSIKLYKKAVDVLIKMQAIDCKNKSLPLYDDHLLKTEMQLLIDWYLDIKIDLHAVFQSLSDNALNSPQVFVHRDYHSRNIMIVKDEIALIDFQDAIIGSNTYDLCSLLKDAYIQLSTDEIQTLLHYYYKQAKIQTSFLVFEKQFELMGLQRHLKILGIFKRLSIRDGKQQYLKNLPLVKKYVLQTATKYPEFSILKSIL